MATMTHLRANENTPVELQTEFQNGELYSHHTCDTDSSSLSLQVNMQQKVSNFFNLKFAHLEYQIRGEKIKILGAQLKLYYTDEYWSKIKYHVSISEALNDKRFSIAKQPEDTVIVNGDKFPADIKTSRPSWITFNIRPELIQKWLSSEKNNKGLFLHLPRVNRGRDGKLVELTPNAGAKSSLFVGFNSCNKTADAKSPRLIVQYQVTGNIPPSTPILSQSAHSKKIYSEARLHWTASTDPNSADSVNYEYQVGYKKNSSINWSAASTQPSGSANSITWLSKKDEQIHYNNSTPAAQKKLWFRIRAYDNHGASSSWNTRGPFLTTSQAWVSWAIHSNKKIWPDSLPPDNVKQVFISAAKNEWEAIQVAIKSHSDISDVTIKVGDLVNNHGNKISGATIYRQHYLNIADTANKKYGRVGPAPDALVPLIHPITGEPTAGKYGGNRFNIAAGNQESFWIDYFINKNTKTGIYKGNVTISTQTQGSQKIPVELEVYDFSLPAKKNLLATFQLSSVKVKRSHPNLKNQPYHNSSLTKLTHDYEEMLHDHYINNWSPVTGFNYTLNGAIVSVDKGKVFVDWTKFDELVTPYMNGSAYKDGIPAQTLFIPYWLPTKRAKSDEWAPRVNRYNAHRIELGLFAQFIREVDRHFTEKGWIDRAYFFYFDEPFLSAWKYKAFIDVSKVVRQFAPNLKIMITDGYKGPEEYKKHAYITEPIEKYVDVWNPVTFQVSSLEKANYYRKRKAEGKFDIWCQTLGNANSKRGVINLFPEFDMPFHRMWGILSWNFGFQGIEWWDTIVWWDPRARKRLDPWTNPVAFPPFDKPLNSDGRLFFPGTEEAVGGFDIPVSSLRMKAVREAIEDYEYLYQLDKLGGKFDINLLHTTEKRRANKMISPMPMGKGPWHWWEGDADEFMKARHFIARKIEKLKEKNK